MSCESAALSFQANANYGTWSINFELNTLNWEELTKNDIFIKMKKFTLVQILLLFLKSEYLLSKQIIELWTTANVCHNPFHATQIINPFLNSRRSANHDKVEGFQPMLKFLCRYCFSIVNYYFKFMHYLTISRFVCK